MEPRIAQPGQIIQPGHTGRCAVLVAAALRVALAALLLASPARAPAELPPRAETPPPAPIPLQALISAAGEAISPESGNPESGTPEFVTQILEPTGGKILRPKDWHYAEGHHGPVYMWTLSREDTADGQKSYETGVRIEVFAYVRQHTGKTPRQFMLDFARDKKADAEVKVVHSCKPVSQGMFTRMCLETEEGPYHILYSLFWGNDDLDIAVVSISGTTRELWTTYAPVFDRMSEFELIDMKRFEK